MNAPHLELVVFYPLKIIDIIALETDFVFLATQTEALLNTTATVA